MKDELIPTNQILIELSRDFEDININNRKLHELVLNAEIPAEVINNRYYARRPNLPEIARIIGAKPKVAAA
jgi:hypothetical protein